MNDMIEEERRWIEEDEEEQKGEEGTKDWKMERNRRGEDRGLEEEEEYSIRYNNSNSIIYNIICNMYDNIIIT